MKNFAALFQALDMTNKTKEKLKVLKEYFSKVSDQDKVWAIALFSHRKPKRPVNTTLLSTWAIEQSKIPTWLFNESYHVVGDLAETIGLLLPFPEHQSDQSLTEWIHFIKEISNLDELSKKEKIISAWNQLNSQERFVFNKILTGAFRVGVSQNLLVQAISELAGIEKAIIAHRIMGNWDPETTSFSSLIHESNPLDDLSKPYPFFLAYPVDGEPQTLGSPADWEAEWKWDGIRAQLIKRQGNFFIWSRGEELITDKFPELEPLGKLLPEGTVLDGELLPFSEGKPLPFSVLQTRIGRKTLTSKILKEAPIAFFAYDMMEWQSEDIRSKSLNARRNFIKNLQQEIDFPNFYFSQEIEFSSWEQLAEKRKDSRSEYAEGFMLKRKTSPYQVGRKRGDWWKWKIEPLTIDAVLIYAQKGHGKRADLFTDYTFAVWKNGELVPFAKAYSGLTDQEIKQVDSFVRRHTVEKFGPVRTVKPELVFEIGFEGIQKSSRHKCGIAVRFPRILRWRQDKKSEEADSLQALQKMLDVYGNRI
jgi:DNA ligase-1